jgi:hypothetical protein
MRTLKYKPARILFSVGYGIVLQLGNLKQLATLWATPGFDCLQPIDSCLFRYVQTAHLNSCVRSKEAKGGRSMNIIIHHHLVDGLKSVKFYL